MSHYPPHKELFSFSFRHIQPVNTGEAVTAGEYYPSGIHQKYRARYRGCIQHDTRPSFTPSQMSRSFTEPVPLSKSQEEEVHTDVT